MRLRRRRTNSSTPIVRMVDLVGREVLGDRPDELAVLADLDLARGNWIQLSRSARTAWPSSEIVGTIIGGPLKQNSRTVLRNTSPATSQAACGSHAGVLDLVSVGGAEGTRTPYLFNAIEALSQLSYSPP